MKGASRLAPGLVENEGFEVVGYHDLQGRAGFKLALHERDGRWFLYTGLLWDHGWAVLDVTDPAHPLMAPVVPGPPGTWTIQVQAAQGLLLAGLEKPMLGWGVPQGAPYAEGAWVFDLTTDPMVPRRVGTWGTGATGTHRNFWNGGRYAWMAATRPGYLGHGLACLDLSDPASPTDVSFWAWPSQVDDGHGVDQSYLHGPAHVRGDRAYLPYGRVGMVVLDVSDVTTPRVVSRLDFGDLGGPVGCHSVVPIGESDLFLVNSEAIAEQDGDQLNYAYVVDLSDEKDPRVKSSLPMPRPSAGLPYASYYEKGGRFGPHNQHHHQNNPAHAVLREHALLTWFSGGLRAYNVRDPLQPLEIGHAVPQDPTRRRGTLPSRLVTQVEDVLVDRRGYIYISDKNHGILVLRYLDGLR